MSVEDNQGITSVSFGFGFTTTCDWLSSLTGELLVLVLRHLTDNRYNSVIKDVNIVHRGVR